MPYPGYPMRAPGIDQPQSQGQPPLIPTGFIQGDQGSLIAVYHPEALDQYMSTTQPATAPAGAGQAPPANANAPAWNPFPQAPAYPFQVPQPFMMPPPFPAANPGRPRPGANAGWMPGLAPPAFAGPLAPPQQAPLRAPLASSNRQMAPSFRGGHFEGQSHTLSKRQHRRDQPNNYHSNRSHHSRGLPGRYPRGGGRGQGTPQPQPPLASPQFNPLGGDWSQWAAGR